MTRIPRGSRSTPKRSEVVDETSSCLPYQPALPSSMSTVTEPKSRKLLGVALFAVTALLLTSCSTPADLTKSDVVGVVAGLVSGRLRTAPSDDVPLNTLSGCYPVGAAREMRNRRTV